MKKRLLSLFSVILMACAIGFMGTIGLFGTSAKAEENQATVSFEMLGASIRVGSDYTGDNQKSGLRFAAQVDATLSATIEADREDDYMFGGVIIPANLLAADAQTSRPAYVAGENIFTYMETYHSSVPLAKMENLTVGHRNGYDIVALSLTNVTIKIGRAHV